MRREGSGGKDEGKEMRLRVRGLGELRGLTWVSSHDPHPASRLSF